MKWKREVKYGFQTVIFFSSSFSPQKKLAAEIKKELSEVHNLKGQAARKRGADAMDIDGEMSDKNGVAALAQPSETIEEKATLTPSTRLVNVVKVKFTENEQGTKGPPKMHPAFDAKYLSSEKMAELEKRKVVAVGRPPRDKQHYDIAKLMDQPRLCWEEESFVIDKTWWDRWESFVNPKNQEVKQADAMDIDEDLSDFPGPIDNNPLLASSGRVVPGLVEDKDYKYVPVHVWRALQAWYGGGPEVGSWLVEVSLWYIREDCFLCLSFFLVPPVPLPLSNG